MPSDRNTRSRCPLRLQGYHSSQAGGYFVTICVQRQQSPFGNVVNEEMHLNNAGHMVQTIWQGLPDRFFATGLDLFVVMPNHFHGIILIVGAGLALPNRGAPTGAGPAAPMGAASSAPTSPTLGEVVRAFKSISATQVNRLLSRSGQPLWQRNYFEHIIRDGKALTRIREYIATNPLRWEFDRENPHRKGEDELDRWLTSFR